jgi:hypothetical protein
LNSVRVRSEYRGSSKRIERIRWRQNTPPGVIAVLAVSVAILLAAVVWLIAMAR